jgi:hypothetical protein
MLRRLLPALLVLAPAAPALAQTAGGGVVLNEIRRDQDGTDNDEYFELAGAPATPLGPSTYLVLGDNTAGGSGVIEAVVDLAGQAIPASGFFVAAEATFTLGTPDLVTDLNFENDESVTHLLVTGFSGAEGDDLDPDDDGDLDVTPWTAVVDAVGLADDMDDLAYGAALGFVDLTTGTSSPPEYVYRDGVTGEWQIGPDDVAKGVDTPGAMNATTVAVEDDAPVALALEAPRPNPARGAATVAFTLAAPGEARLAVYDALGRRVALLAEGPFAAGTRHAVALDASRLAPGAYVVRLEAGGRVASHPLAVVR